MFFFSVIFSAEVSRFVWAIPLVVTVPVTGENGMFHVAVGFVTRTVDMLQQTYAVNFAAFFTD